MNKKEQEEVSLYITQLDLLRERLDQLATDSEKLTDTIRILANPDLTEREKIHYITEALKGGETK